MLIVGQRRALAGGAGDHQRVDALVDLPVDQPAQGLVVHAGMGQGGDQRRGGAAKDGLPAHSDSPLWRCSAYCNSVCL